MTTLIFEPHADDAWLSLGEHLLARAFGQVAIVTVWGDATRMKEAERYATTVAEGRWRGLGIPEGNFGNREAWTTDPPPLELLSDVIESFQPRRVIGPLGLQHPEHLALRDGLDRILGGAVDLYVELPYALTQANGGALLAALDQLDGALLSARVRSAAANTSAHIFASQSQFWRFNRERMVGAMELVIGTP